MVSLCSLHSSISLYIQCPKARVCQLRFSLALSLCVPITVLVIAGICFYFSLEILIFFCLSHWLNNLDSSEGNLKFPACIKTRRIQYLCWNIIRWITFILLEVSVSSVRKMTSLPPLSSRKLGKEKVRNLSILISRACVYQQWLQHSPRASPSHAGLLLVAVMRNRARALHMVGSLM